MKQVLWYYCTRCFHVDKEDEGMSNRKYWCKYISWFPIWAKLVCKIGEIEKQNRPNW